MAVKFSKKEALNFGWQTFKRNTSFLIAIVIISLIPTFFTSFINSIVTKNSPELTQILAAILRVGLVVIQMILQLGLIRIYIDFTDGKKDPLNTLWSQSGLFFKYIITVILYGLIVLAGLILFIVPGIIWGIKYQFYNYLLVDKKLWGITALKESAKITKGQKWNLFLFNLLVLAISIGGVLAFFVGSLVATPITMLATAYIYVKLKSA